MSTFDSALGLEAQGFAYHDALVTPDIHAAMAQGAQHRLELVAPLLVLERVAEEHHDGVVGQRVKIEPGRTRASDR